MKIAITLTIDARQFGENVSEKTMRCVIEDIIMRYCNTEYYNIEELEKIAENRLDCDDIYNH